MLKPLFNNILVKIIANINQDEGIILSTKDKNLMLEAEVLGVGHELNLQDLPFQIHDHIYIKDYAGYHFTQGDVTYKVIETKDILGLKTK